MHNQDFETIITFLRDELGALHTGRATPALVEDIKVQSYGSFLPVQQLGNISVPEANMIVIEPWDKSVLKDMEKAIATSDLGVNPVNEGTLLRLVFPPLTEERRDELVKIIHKKLEEAKVRVKNAREKTIKELRAQEANGEMSEDDLHQKQKHVQDEVDRLQAKLKEITQKKEQEVQQL